MLNRNYVFGFPPAIFLAILLVAFLFLNPLPAYGQLQSATSGPEPVPGAALPRELIELRREGGEALYNIDYETAVAKYEEIRKRMPQHPAGDIYLATALWLRNLNKNRRLQTGLYSRGSNFYAGADKAREETEGDAVDPAVDRAFRDRMAQAKTKALALVAKNKNDPDALYYLGAYYGIMAGYEATTARKFYSAMRNGSRSVDVHEKVLKMRPDYYDALLSVGMYDYIAGSLPFGIKALALFAGVRGNKERGISRLKTIIENNAVTADDARVMLIAIYRNEKRNEDALQVVNHLTARYPKSYLLKLEAAALLVSLKRAEEAYAAFEALLKDPTAASVYDLVNYQYAEALARAGEYQRAAQQFTSVPKVQGGDANLATVSLLRAGQVYDLAGNREEAIAQYKAVLARPNIYDTQMQAEKGLNKPFAEREKKGE